MLGSLMCSCALEIMSPKLFLFTDVDNKDVRRKMRSNEV